MTTLSGRAQVFNPSYELQQKADKAGTSMMLDCFLLCKNDSAEELSNLSSELSESGRLAAQQPRQLSRLDLLHSHQRGDWDQWIILKLPKDFRSNGLEGWRIVSCEASRCFAQSDISMLATLDLHQCVFYLKGMRSPYLSAPILPHCRPE